MSVVAQVRQVVRYPRTYKLEGGQTQYALEVYKQGRKTTTCRMDLVSNHRITPVSAPPCWAGASTHVWRRI